MSIRKSKRRITELEEEEEMIECEGIGESVFDDENGKVFYKAFKTCDLTISIGDCVRIRLATSKNGLDEFSFAQVLAVYEEYEEIFAEVRWLLQPHEMTDQHRKTVSPQEDELIESDTLDDISAGSMIEVIEIENAANFGQRQFLSKYTIRFLETKESNSLQRVSPKDMLRRGLNYSEYQYAYTELLSSLVGDASTDDFSIALRRLHLSVVPESLPCRTGEREYIESFIRNGVINMGCTNPYYICGVPGSGKTATVLATIQHLEKESSKGLFPAFQFIELNCLRLKHPNDAYSHLWRALSGTYCAGKSALNQLEKYFTQPSKKSNKVTVCLLDELDYLVTRNFEVIYNFYNWTRLENSRFVMLCVANLMDLPEQLNSRLASRSSTVTSRLIFKPYTHDQVRTILEHRLKELNLHGFNAYTVEFLARKASVAAGGDLRNSLRVCQGALRKYRDQQRHLADQQQKAKQLRGVNPSETEAESKKSDQQQIQLAMKCIREALEEFRSSPVIRCVVNCCQLDKIILVVFAKYLKQAEFTGIKEGLSIDDLWDRVVELLNKIESERLIRDNKSKNQIICIKPNFHVFEMAVTRLLQRGLLRKGVFCKEGPRSALMTLPELLPVGDLMAALHNDVLAVHLSV